MKQLMQIFAGVGLTLAGLTAVPAVADAHPRHHHADRHDRGPHARDHDRRRWDNRRHWDDRRGWNDRRGWDNRRAWNDRRRWDDRRWDGRRDRYGYRGERIIYGGSREAAAMGVEYRGPCRYVIRNGRRVCG